MSRSENVPIVAFDADMPVGYLVAYLLDRVDRDQQMMFFYEIGVAESHRRQGIGKRMIAALKAICRSKNVMKIVGANGPLKSRSHAPIREHGRSAVAGRR